MDVASALFAAVIGLYCRELLDRHAPRGRLDTDEVKPRNPRLTPLPAANDKFREEQTFPRQPDAPG